MQKCRLKKKKLVCQSHDLTKPFKVNDSVLWYLHNLVQPPFCLVPNSLTPPVRPQTRGQVLPNPSRLCSPQAPPCLSEGFQLQLLRTALQTESVPKCFFLYLISIHRLLTLSFSAHSGVASDEPLTPSFLSPLLPLLPQGSTGTPQTSRMPVPMSSKNRPGSLDKPGKQSKLQDPRQYRQVVLP